MFSLRFLERYAPCALAVLRVVTGLTFLAHGLQKLVGFPVAPERGFPAAFSLMWAGAVLELVGGVLIVVGLGTRPIALLLSGEMAVAYWLFHAPGSIYPVVNGGDAAILYCFVFLYFAFVGAGSWSVDSRLKR
ncbi:DoxX family protein [Sphingomonas sp. Leaf343]|uniref:DoxX family protein n=1 Tax=Sphingomonas sp. Leaf343 TaxID=1736345 RepID=UPI000701B172|nr:DoxX family protein [Sphingomonas sp. Leaf343]KQR82330.1 DoxX family protein [Sphingomonas sp. Leaf343]